MQLVARPEVGVGVHVARDDGAAADVEHGGVLRNGDRTARSHRLDPVVANDDVRVLDHLVSRHRDRASAPQHGDARRDIPRRLDQDPVLDGPVPLILFVFPGFLVFFLLFLL